MSTVAVRQSSFLRASRKLDAPRCLNGTNAQMPQSGVFRWDGTRQVDKAVELLLPKKEVSEVE